MEYHKTKFKEGDLVVALGSTKTSEGYTDTHRVLAIVAGIGKHDLFVKEEGSSRVFKISKCRCVSIDDSSIDATSPTLEPELGDLVLSMIDRFNNVDKKIGILMEIIDMPGRTTIARIMCGDKSETVSLNTLIVLEENKKVSIH